MFNVSGLRLSRRGTTVQRIVVARRDTIVICLITNNKSHNIHYIYNLCAQI